MISTLRSLQRRLIRHIEAGRTTDLADAPMRHPASVYSDPARHELERERLFLRLPLVACLSGDIPEAGDTALFEGAGRPIVVVRDAAGRANAFLNLCTHRGARPVTTEGRHDCFTCPFHGWTYGLDGALIGQPGKIGFEGLDTARMGLVRVPCAERHGLVFVRAQPDGEPIDVDAHLGAFGLVLAEIGLSGYRRVKSGIMQAAGNWKYVLETFGEGYHFASLHPTSLGQTHYSNVAVFDAFDRHHRVCFAPKAYKALATRPEAEWPVPDSVVYNIFPNTAMLVGSPMQGHYFVQLFRIYPTAVDRTDTQFTLYAPPSQLEGPGRAMAEAGFDLARQIIETEDFSVSGGAQRNFAQAPAGVHVVYGRNEPALQHLHRGLNAELAD
ncbi:MAG TPA: aromatic ring-hydroxylating dioxygenase subunit alpha [Nevskiaceae bacterium]|nr:aromatic ring-hydroxylating dioxygenase subunit alpha [Nevskiaceae bacterium]